MRLYWSHLWHTRFNIIISSMPCGQRRLAKDMLAEGEEVILLSRSHRRILTIINLHQQVCVADGIDERQLVLTSHQITPIIQPPLLRPVISLPKACSTREPPRHSMPLKPR